MGSSQLLPKYKLSINNVEMIQRRAAQFAYNKYHNSVSISSMHAGMLESLGWPILYMHACASKKKLHQAATNLQDSQSHDLHTIQQF